MQSRREIVELRHAVQRARGRGRYPAKIREQAVALLERGMSVPLLCKETGLPAGVVEKWSGGKGPHGVEAPGVFEVVASPPAGDSSIRIQFGSLVLTVSMAAGVP